MMNREAAAPGPQGTHFANATGSPPPGHYSTARDIATLAAALIRDFPDRYPLYSQREFTYNQHHAGEPQPAAVDRSRPWTA